MHSALGGAHAAAWRQHHPNAVISQRIDRLLRRMSTILWILAVVLVVAGIFAIVRRQLLWGIVLIVVGLLVGPGGVSLFT
jgi:hypothetical protein